MASAPQPPRLVQRPTHRRARKFGFGRKASWEDQPNADPMFSNEITAEPEPSVPEPRPAQDVMTSSANVSDGLQKLTVIITALKEDARGARGREEQLIESYRPPGTAPDTLIALQEALKLGVSAAEAKNNENFRKLEGCIAELRGMAKAVEENLRLLENERRELKGKN